MGILYIEDRVVQKEELNYTLQIRYFDETADRLKLSQSNLEYRVINHQGFHLLILDTLVSISSMDTTHPLCFLYYLAMSCRAFDNPW